MAPNPAAKRTAPAPAGRAGAAAAALVAICVPAAQGRAAEQGTATEQNRRTAAVATLTLADLAPADPAPAAAAPGAPAGPQAAEPRPALAQAQAETAPKPAETPDPQQLLLEQAREGNSEALAKEAQNPVASLISVPIQWNSTPATQWAPTSVDPAARANRTLNIWNLQPVVPFALNERLNLISRVIVPLIQRPWQGDSNAVGLGDINPTLFLVPRTRGPLQIGFGPTLLIPSATDSRIGSQRWSAGPAAVAVYTKGPLVGGMLINNIWSFAGSGGQDVSAMLIQPFLNINFPSGWYLASSPIITADWMAAGGRGWTVPIGGGIGRIFRIGRQPFNSSLQVFWNAVRPRVAGEDLLGPVTIRLQLQALFPTGR